MLKAVFFDIDGTLLSHRTNSVPASALRALELLREKGILTFMATGRHISMLRQLKALEGLQFDGVVSLNGQYCCDESGILYHCPLETSAVASLLDYLKAHPHPCILVEADRMYINFHSPLVERVQAAIHSEMPELGDLDRGYTQPIYQAILYMSEENLAKLPPLPGIKLTRWNLGGADLIPAKGGKAAGITKLLEHYGIDKSETMAFGDGDNDLDMFGAVGFSVAMGNAVPQLRTVADYITTDTDDDGIAKALKHFGLIS